MRTVDGKITRPIEFNERLVYQTSKLITSFPTLPNADLILAVIEAQEAESEGPASPASNNPIDITDLAIAASASSPIGGLSKFFSAIWTGAVGNWSDPTNWSINPRFPNNDQPNVGDRYSATLNNGGTITLDIPVTIQNFTLSSGTVTGANNLTINQLFTWSAGTMSVAGVTNANGGIVFGNSQVDFTQGTLNNAVGQTATLSGALADIAFQNGAVFNNNGTFLAQNDRSLFNSNLGGTFNNNGTFTRDTAAGTFLINTNVVFNNSGTLNVNSGTLELKTLVNSSGPINVNGATLNLTGTFMQTGGAIALYSGTLAVVGGNASANLITGTSGMINVTGFFGSLSVANGFDFRGINNIPTSGGTLTLTAPSVTFAPGAINGALFTGGDAAVGSGQPGGDGGNFTVTATSGNIVVGTNIDASTGANDTVPNGGTGGTVSLTANNGTVGINGRIQVSNSAAGRQSARGGNINITSGKPTGVAINVSNSAQLLALLDAAAPGPGGIITITATAAAGNSQINVSGAIEADKGGIDVRHMSDSGVINVNNANMLADIIKIAALGSNGTLNIGGGILNADTVLKLYAPGSNGSIIFVADCSIGGKVTNIVAANSVTINNGVFVNVTGRIADVFVNSTLGVPNANYTGFGGNNTTTGTFTGLGANNPQPLANAPPLGPPGGP